MIPANKILFVMKDQLKGYEADASVDLVPGSEQFLSVTEPGSFNDLH